MRSFHLTFCLLSAVFIFSGCSQTGALRSSNTSDVKTIASIGDKPLPIVSGEPGASLRAETEDVDRPVQSGSRISGRVYDERGKPVQGVKVRLAVGGTAGGKAVVATTDRSGAFTLSGLRSGSAYTVIAEYEDEEGAMSGRVQVKAPRTDVRIALQAQGGSSQGHASIRPARPRIEPISNVDSSDEDSFDESDGRSGSRINPEDLEPPAAEATALLSERDSRARRSSAGNSQPSGRAGWNFRQAGSKAGTGSGSASRAHDDSGEPTDRPGSSSQSSADAEDDGPNPLPPAIESGASNGIGRPRALVEENLIRTAQTESDGASQPPHRAVRAVSKRDDPQPGNGEGQPVDQAPQPIPKELVEADGSDPDSSARTVRRPTWGEIAGKQANVPLDESVRRAKSDAPRSDQGVVTLTSTNPPPKSGLARLLGSPPAALDEAVKQSACSIDGAERRLIDFKLPDLNGKLVSLHDIDADVILLDFWGSWCQPCRKSIPHLIELQKKFAGKRFSVIGVACEKAAAPRDRQASALKAVNELGITYPVLLSGRDGTCPLQQALQIQFYPTMVLITRDGKLLAREHGATDITLPRMDRAIASALRGQGRGAGN